MDCDFAPYELDADCLALEKEKNMPLRSKTLPDMMRNTGTCLSMGHWSTKRTPMRNAAMGMMSQNTSATTQDTYEEADVLDALSKRFPASSATIASSGPQAKKLTSNTNSILLKGLDYLILKFVFDSVLAINTKQSSYFTAHFLVLQRIKNS